MSSPQTTPQPNPKPKPKRSRGAQLGNNNALRHGFYSREFRKAESDDLPNLELRLDDEIAAARIAGRRMLELTNEMPDPWTGIRALSIFSGHLNRIAHLMRTHAILTGSGSDTAEVISTAIQAIAKEFKIL